MLNNKKIHQLICNNDIFTSYISLYKKGITRNKSNKYFLNLLDLKKDYIKEIAETSRQFNFKLIEFLINKELKKIQIN